MGEQTRGYFGLFEEPVYGKRPIGGEGGGAIFEQGIFSKMG